MTIMTNDYNDLSMVILLYKSYSITYSGLEGH